MTVDSNHEEAFAHGRELVGEAIREIGKAVFGIDEQLKLIFAAYIARAKAVLLKAAPGTAKTMSARALAKVVEGSFGRIQMSADKLPSDITGVELYNPKTGEFEVIPGSVIVNSNLILIDEINRAGPKTQSALLEAVEEGQVTIGSLSGLATFMLKEPYLVIMTRNSIEQEGTYPLSEALLDRIMLELKYDMLSEFDEARMLKGIDSHKPMADRLGKLRTVMSVTDLLGIRDAVMDSGLIKIDERVVEYIVRLTHEVRAHPARSDGISPRCSLDLKHLSTAYAYISGLDYVHPDIVQKLAPSVLAHRLFLKDEERNKMSTKDVIEESMRRVPRV